MLPRMVLLQAAIAIPHENRGMFQAAGFELQKSEDLELCLLALSHWDVRIRVLMQCAST